MHEMVVEQRLSAIARRNSPKPASSARDHSALLMRHGPGWDCPWKCDEIVATRGGVAIAVDCTSLFQPDNAMPSAATKSNAFTERPTLARRNSRWNEDSQQSGDNPWSSPISKRRLKPGENSVFPSKPGRQTQSARKIAWRDDLETRAISRSNRAAWPTDFAAVAALWTVAGWSALHSLPVAQRARASSEPN